MTHADVSFAFMTKKVVELLTPSGKNGGLMQVQPQELVNLIIATHLGMRMMGFLSLIIVNLTAWKHYIFLKIDYFFLLAREEYLL